MTNLGNTGNYDLDQGCSLRTEHVWPFLSNLVVRLEKLL